MDDDSDNGSKNVNNVYSELLQLKTKLISLQKGLCDCQEISTLHVVSEDNRNSEFELFKGEDFGCFSESEIEIPTYIDGVNFSPGLSNMMKITNTPADTHLVSTPSQRRHDTKIVTDIHQEYVTPDEKCDKQKLRKIDGNNLKIDMDKGINDQCSLNGDIDINNK
eukprot:CAMPEP_0194425312 /NCGR_PEP_ID=MMETSP0176-20130528/24657_1 /TAXON_ID=216777 /ORGANISM="Proboscia alata, Strain PI-D3" /LENGTH=164 /DNA_ID=CAMNT_0039235611 /DNA_START=64 /DNA_END=555 /DNA_ORIENTATION=+